ncbi:MAG: SUR7/PalI family protein [Methanobrevibacter sp.]|nr:SUR7/PalI family protein [Methanobrevibacter sp.]
MDLKKIGIFLIFVGIVVSVMFVGNHTYLVPALTITVLGFFITVVGFVVDVKKRKIINDQLDEDVSTKLQPLITKYSNLNKEYKNQLSDDEYAKKRLEMNKDLEAELVENLPYLESREIKKIIITFNREQDKM